MFYLIKKKIMEQFISAIKWTFHKSRRTGYNLIARSCKITFMALQIVSNCFDWRTRFKRSFSLYGLGCKHNFGNVFRRYSKRWWRTYAWTSNGSRQAYCLDGNGYIFPASIPIPNTAELIKLHFVAFCLK